MHHINSVETLLELFCTCEDSFECEWHERLRHGADRRDVQREMQGVLDVSHAIDREVIDPPSGWVPFRGTQGEYWRREAI